jgi:hypothetical protein
LREAAGRLEESPTKAEYEELGLTPASATVIRVFGSWKEAKRAAGLTTEVSTGTRVQPAPDNVELPDGEEWESLSVDQRWHYRNIKYNTERSLQRRARLRSWVNEQKRASGCRECEEIDPRCLDFHHIDPESKTRAIGEMITYGYGRDSLRAEIEKCVVLCANCHRSEHGEVPENPDSKRERQQVWLADYQSKAGGCQRCSEDDPRCLVFHHSGEKNTTVARLVANSASRAELRVEVERCIVFCSNCHRKEHVELPDGSA